jgi:uncharacterized protein (TIGR02118 family)
LLDGSAGLPRYVQNHCIEGRLGTKEPPFLGMGEVWFDREAEAQQALATPEWRAMLEDAATFMDMNSVTAGWPEEHQLV